MDARIDIVVIGAGVTGAAIAYFLARAGRKVGLFEQGVPGGQGATRHAGAIVRAYDPDPVWRALGTLGASAFAQWRKARMPGPSPLRSIGFVYLAGPSSAPDLDGMRQALSTREYPVALLTRDHIQRRLPWLRAGRTPLGLLERRGGVGDPRLTAALLVAGVRALGGRVFDNCSVQAIAPLQRGFELRLPASTLQAGTVVLAAGAYSQLLVPELPVYVRSIPLLEFTGDGDFRTAVVDECAGTYLVPKSGGFLAGSQVVEVLRSAGAATAGDPALVARDGRSRLRELVGSATRYRMLNCSAGMDAYTADQRPLLGPLPGTPDLYVATGFSGRGYKCCLAVGQLVAAELTGAALEPAQQALLNALRPQRFAAIGDARAAS